MHFWEWSVVGVSYGVTMETTYMEYQHAFLQHTKSLRDSISMFSEAATGVIL